MQAITLLVVILAVYVAFFVPLSLNILAV